MPNLRPIEILLIVLVVLLLFGAKRLPDLARSVGRSMKILKTEVKDLNDDDRPGATSPTGAPRAPAASAEAPTTPGTAYTEPVRPARAADDTDRKQA